MGAQKNTDTGDQLEALRALIDTAGGVLRLLTADPLLGRLIAAFERVPAEDRETIVKVLEHEVGMRLLATGQGDVLTGRSLVPNPNARLYMRVVEGRIPPRALNRDQIMRATLRAGHVIRLTHEMPERDWQGTVLEAIRSMDPEDRAAIVEHYRSMLDLLEADEARTATGG